MILYWTVRTLQSLGRDHSNLQIAWGVSLGMLLGLIPFATLHWLLVFCLVLATRVNLIAAFFSASLFSIVYFLAHSSLESLGFWALTSQPILTPLWTRAYHAPILPFTAFNHSDVMGGTLLGIFFFIPVFGFSMTLAKKYRSSLHAFWLSTRIQRAYAHQRRFYN